MTKTAKRLTAAVLSLALVITLIPLMSLTVHAKELNKGSYTIDLTGGSKTWTDKYEDEEYQAYDITYTYLLIKKRISQEPHSGTLYIDLDKDGSTDMTFKFTTDATACDKAAPTHSKTKYVFTLSDKDKTELEKRFPGEAYYEKITYLMPAVKGMTRITSLTNAAKGFKLVWNKISGAAGYEVWRSENGGKYIKAKTLSGSGTVTFTNTADAADKNGVKYQYKVRAYKGSGELLQHYPFSAVRTTYKVTRPTIKTISNTGKGIKLTWAKNSKATGYQIWRSDDGGKSYIKAKTISNPNTTSFSNSAANKNGKKYYYKMRSYKTVSGTTYYSAYSPVKTITRKV